MTTNVERLVDKLYGPQGIGATNIKFTRGSNPAATAEDIAGEILQSIERIERGDFEVVNPDSLD